MLSIVKRSGFCGDSKRGVCTADFELALHVCKGAFGRLHPVCNVVNNDMGIGIIVNGDDELTGKLLPYAADVMDEIDESRRSISMLEGHCHVGPFDGINPLKCKLLKALKGNGELMLPYRRAEHIHPFSKSELVEYLQICNDKSDSVERNVIYTEVSNEVLDVDNMLS
jgi:hypothetical protein